MRSFLHEPHRNGDSLQAELFAQLVFKKLPEIWLHQERVITEKGKDRPGGIDLGHVLDLQLLARFCGNVRL